jgi:ABC-type spermidine/putrescine transport system permease subunit I
VTAGAAGTTRRRRGSRTARSRSLGAFFAALPPILLVAVFAGLPILLAVGYSLGHTGGLNSVTASYAQHQYVSSGGLGTTGAYREMLGSQRFRVDVVVTVLVTVLSTAIVLALSLGIALNLRLRGGIVARAIAALGVVPLFIPVVIASWAILTFYSSDGFIRSVFAQFGIDAPSLGFKVATIVIGSVWTSLPFAVLMISSGVQAVPDSVIDAARDSGAGLVRTTRSVIVPMAFIPIVIATTFTAIGVLGSFTVPYFTGPNSPRMLGVDIQNYFSSYNQPQQAIVIAVTIFVLASGIAVAYIWANFRSANDKAL